MKITRYNDEGNNDRLCSLLSTLELGLSGPPVHLLCTVTPSPSPLTPPYSPSLSVPLLLLPEPPRVLYRKDRRSYNHYTQMSNHQTAISAILPRIASSHRFASQSLSQPANSPYVAGTTPSLPVAGSLAYHHSSLCTSSRMTTLCPAFMLISPG